MKKLYTFFVLIATLFLAQNSFAQGPWTTCAAAQSDIVIVNAVGPSITTFIQGIDSPDKLKASSIPTSAQTMADNYAFLVTTTNGQTGVDPQIVGISTDGTFDFPSGGKYCYYGLIYDQSNLNALASWVCAQKSLICALYPQVCTILDSIGLCNQTPITVNFSDLIGILTEITATSASIDSSVAAIMTVNGLAPNLGGPYLCIGVTSELYCVDVTFDGTGVNNIGSSFAINAVSTGSSKQQAQVSFITNQHDLYSTSVYDITGKLVGTKSMDCNAGKNQVTIEGNFGAGVYYAVVTNGKQRESKKFIIQ